MEARELLAKVLQDNIDRGYTPIKAVQIENFMSIKQALVEFDDSNVINLKGYNDSGKSAVLRAIEVCLENKYSKDQSKFIMDGADYFRVVVSFTDGTLINRVRYINNQSLYEMYNGDTLLFTTKNNDFFGKVVDVPEVIEAYVGMLKYRSDKKPTVYVQSRSCFDDQFLVQTSGKENAEMLNVVLENEELAYAISMLNADKNKQNQLVKAKQEECNVLDNMLRECSKMGYVTLETLQKLDKDLDTAEEGYSKVTELLKVCNELDSIKDIPHLDTVNTEQLTTLQDLEGTVAELMGIEDIPHLDKMDMQGLELLQELQEVVDNLEGITEYPSIDEIDLVGMLLLQQIQDSMAELEKYEDTPYIESIEIDGVGYLEQITDLVNQIGVCDTTIEDLVSQEKALVEERAMLESTIRESGVKIVSCNKCGNLIEIV